MTLEVFLRGLSQVFLLVVAGSTVWNWARYRDRTRRDIALVFVTLTASIILEDLQNLIGIELPWLLKLGPLVVISHPYFLLRLAQYFKPVRKGIQRAALAGLLLSWIVLIVAAEPYSLAVGIFIIGYFAVVEVYATAVLIRGALTIPGITGKRLRLVSLGSGLLALLFIIAIVFALFLGPNASPNALSSLFNSVLQVMLILSGLAYYLGFSPPRWLKHFWQLSELEYFLDRRSKGLLHDRSVAFEELSNAALRTVGGATAVIAARDAEDRGLSIVLPGEPPFPAGDMTARPVTDVIGKAWREGKAFAVQIPRETEADINRWAEGFNARALLIVPIQGVMYAWGLLIVALRYDPLFPQDDLDVLTLLAEQSATQLNYLALNRELQQTNQSLEYRVSERTLLLEKSNRDLEDQIAERKRDQEKIEQMNDELEHRVRERTAQLESANTELESFSYSVSHDLRTPLRSIDGFSQIMLEDYGPQLPHEGRDNLIRIRTAVQRMSELIDDLLDLAHVTRGVLQPKLVNLSEMAEQIAGNLKAESPKRIITLSITPDLTVNGDPRLLRILLENLLSNAWKFTSKKEQAVIDFGQQDRDGKLVFFIRDNGAGFDMAYVNKLFGVFQRLHLADEYPGTGVGLATVQRIIKAHGGDIWAEAEEGKGASFYFTL